MMKKRLCAIIAAVFAMAVLVALSGCGGNSTSATTDESSDTNSDGPTGTISVISREDGSGTRGAFVELLGIEEEDSSGQTVDMTTPSAVITNSTQVMMTTVSGDENAIGYISLGSLNDTVKALEVDGVAATTENVKNGTYVVSRPFNIVLNGSESPAAENFVAYIMSADGQKIVEDNGYIAVDENAAAFTPSDVSGRVVVAGSSSVTPVMEKLAEAYETVNPNVTIEVNQSDSTTGVNSMIDATADIGMASRDLKDSETQAGVQSETIAQDGIAVIVNNDNTIDNLTTEQIRAIFTGEITEWSEV